jgi:hypothetical protein
MLAASCLHVCTSTSVFLYFIFLYSVFLHICLPVCLVFCLLSCLLISEPQICLNTI